MTVYTGYELRNGVRVVMVEVDGAQDASPRLLAGWGGRPRLGTRSLVGLSRLILADHLQDEPLGEALADQFEPVLARLVDWQAGWSVSSKQIGRWLEERQMYPLDRERIE